MKKSTIIILSIVGSVLLVLGIFIFINFDKFYFSSVSVKYSCGEINDTDLEEMGYSVYGIYSGGNITLYSSDIGTLKHENCHLVQEEQGRFFSCRNKLLKYFNEVECYFAEDYSNSFYEKFYNLDLSTEGH
jgi:hypothetical protein